jgi:phenylpyruvate tautomerase PptA (4-oxalocrotonate tautomerase family)
VPEGQYDDERRAAVTKAMTEAVVEVEGDRWPQPEERVWVFTYEVKDGRWGGMGGRVLRLPDIYEHVVGEKGRDLAEQVLAARRREEAQRLLASVGEAVTS